MDIKYLKVNPSGSLSATAQMENEIGKKKAEAIVRLLLNALRNKKRIS
jgi:hypothetical protein